MGLARRWQAGVLRGAALSVLPLLLPLLLCTPSKAAAEIVVTDDANRRISLPRPAKRIVSLAPHTTELLFAAGAGPYIVGVTEYSDYPAEAKKIQSVGNGVMLDIERILQLKPDLIVGWNNGNAGAQIVKFEELGIPLFKSDPHDFGTIASALERLSRLAGTETTGKQAADAFRTRWKNLEAAYRDRSPVRVFVQVWRSPLMTLNDAATPSAALRLCGGQNIFGKLPMIAPTVTMEAVIKEDPDVILGGSGENGNPLAMWQRFPTMKAVARNNLLLINGELLNRSGPRILDGTEALCKQLDAARARK
jgi:iron complex transport system substrate-binding protein